MARDSLAACLQNAVNTLNELMMNGSQRVRLDAAVQVLRLRHVDDVVKGYEQFGFGE
jgi:hypothetical protein